jgi:hypothetical protein
VRAARHARPLVELAQDPALLVAQKSFDLAPRRAQRRGDAQALRGDRDAEGAAAAAGEAVLHGAAAEHDQQSAVCWS